MTGTLKIKANDETLNLLKGAINKFQYSKIMSTMDSACDSIHSHKHTPGQNWPN